MAFKRPLPAALGEVFGGYELVRVLSQGGMGSVYQGVHTRLGRIAAVKVLATHLMGDEDLVARFFREAKIVNDVRHPNIVDIFDFVETEEPPRVACVMEFIEGPTLKAVVKRRPLTPRQSIHLALQMVDALRAVHSQGVIHRDLKPTNIIVTGNLRSDLSEVPSLKILDFGIAKIDVPGENRTASGTMLGTPAYMAPEQVAADTVDASIDVYALGEILYEMLTGQRAFVGSRAKVLKAKVVGATPPLPMPKEIPGAGKIRALITEAIAHEPTARPSLDTFEQVLERLLEEDELDGPAKTAVDAPTLPTFPQLSPPTPDLDAPTQQITAPPISATFSDAVPAVEATEASASGSLVPDGKPRPGRFAAIALLLLLLVAAFLWTRPPPERSVAGDVAPPVPKEAPPPGKPAVAPPPPPPTEVKARKATPAKPVVKARKATPAKPVVKKPKKRRRRRAPPPPVEIAPPPPPPPPPKPKPADPVKMPDW